MSNSLCAIPLEFVDVDRIFSDKASGKVVRRPQLKALMDFVRDGDTVIVHSMDRLARNLDDHHEEYGFDLNPMRVFVHLLE